MKSTIKTVLNTVIRMSQVRFFSLTGTFIVKFTDLQNENLATKGKILTLNNIIGILATRV